MNWLLVWVHVLALGVWLGETVFFGAVLAPALFGSLGPEQAGTITALIFPGYYTVGYVCGVLLVLTALALWQRSRPVGGLWLGAAAVAALMLGACLFAGLEVLPEAAALRPLLHDAAAASSVREQFDDLHQLAVQLNMAVLIGNLVLAGLVAARLSSGIVPRRRLSRYSSDPLL
jgi:uncharacterized membrane protein